MTIWRPRRTIQVKALGLVWRNGLLLASDVYLDDGTVKGVRPLGGRLNFGETWRNALVREFAEELDVVATVGGDPLVLESIYTHQGMQGHEITFICDVTLPPDAFEGNGPIGFFEDTGEKCIARWHDIADLDGGGLELYPTGLKTHLQDRQNAQK